jgi:hypothetical protein
MITARRQRSECALEVLDSLIELAYDEMQISKVAKAGTKG